MFNKNVSTEQFPFQHLNRILKQKGEQIGQSSKETFSANKTESSITKIS